MKCSPNHKNPTNSTWLKQRFYFYDVDLNDPNKPPIYTSITVSDVLDIENSLRYVYEGNSAGMECCTPPPTALEEIPEGAIKVPIRRNAVRHRIVVPSALQSRIRSFEPSAGPERSRAYVLHIDGLVVLSNTAMTVHVFADLPANATEAAVGGPNYLGFFSIVPHTTGERVHRNPPEDIRLPVTSEIGKFLKSKGDLTVTLVPVDPQEQPLNITLTYRNIYIREH
jgi:hypothetical protein